MSETNNKASRTLLIFSLSLIGVLGFVLIFRYSNLLQKQATTEKLYKAWADSVKKSYDIVIQLKEDTIDISREKEALYVDSIVLLNKKVELNNQKILAIKKEYHEKINHLNSLSTDELAEFFKKRYGQE